MTSSTGEGTGSLEKALDVLDAIGEAPEGLGQSDLAERLGLPRTTVYRLLATLVARGMVRRDPLRKVYRLGFRCFEMARQAADGGFDFGELGHLTGYIVSLGCGVSTS